MRVQDIEIPHEHERGPLYRFFEILPGVLSYAITFTPLILALINPAWSAYFLVVFVLIWFAKALAMSVRVLQGHKRVQISRKLDWRTYLKDLDDPKASVKKYEQQSLDKMTKIHLANLRHVAERGPVDLKADDIIHVVIIATYNESQDIIHPTVEGVIDSLHLDPQKQIAFFLAYEDRAGEVKAKESKATVKKYKDKFLHAETVRHKLLEGEIKGKGGNATFAGRRALEWAQEQSIDPSRVMVTVLDADNRPDPAYLAALSYSYIVADKRKKRSYQPIAMYINNIWDAPAIMRLCACNNTFFHTGNSMRLHALRNFSAHSQSLDSLIDSDFWSVRTIVEDGHQFWRMYFTYDGDHDVVPLYVPIYQDAVLASSYRKTIVAQFKQIRRWTYGASDVAYMATRAFFMPNKINKFDATLKFFRLLEQHVSWSTSSLLLVMAGWIPLLVSQESSVVALQFPAVMFRVNTIGSVIVLASMYIGIVYLPPRPPHYSRFRWVMFLLQWLLIPIVGVVFNSFAAYYSQTRLMIGKYFGDFDVTEKAVKKVS